MSTQRIYPDSMTAAEIEREEVERFIETPAARIGRLHGHAKGICWTCPVCLEIMADQKRFEDSLEG